MKSYLFFLILLLQIQPLTADVKKEKLVFIHGLMNPYSMNSMHKMFRKNGWDVENYKYPSRDKTIEKHAQDLVLKLKDLDSNNGRPMNFVAFSLGGLVLRAALNLPDCPESSKDGKIILISSPTNGSKTARFLGKSKLLRKILGQGSGKDLYSTPENGFSDHGNFPKTAKILVISGTFGFNPVLKGKNDCIVSVNESCIKTPHLHEHVSATHKWITTNMRTINLVDQFLNQEK